MFLNSLYIVCRYVDTSLWNLVGLVQKQKRKCVDNCPWFFRKIQTLVVETETHPPPVFWSEWKRKFAYTYVCIYIALNENTWTELRRKEWKILMRVILLLILRFVYLTSNKILLSFYRHRLVAFRKQTCNCFIAHV